MKLWSSFLIMVLFSIMPMAAGCGSTVKTSSLVILSWEAPTLNEDGTTLTDLAGYRVYYGESMGSYTDSISVGIYPAATIDNLGPGQTLYFSVTAFDLNGNESDHSNEIMTTVPGTN